MELAPRRSRGRGERGLEVAILFGTTALFAGGCSRDEPDLPSAPPLLERLALSPVGGPAAPGDVRIVASFAVRDGALPEQWEVLADSFEVARVPPVRNRPGYESVRLSGATGPAVGLRGPFELDSFNQVAVTVALARGKEDVGAVLAADRGAWAQRSKRFDAGDGRPQTIVFDMETARGRPGTQDDVVVRFGDLAPRVDLLSIDLLWKPLHEWVPPPDRPPSHVAIADESRLAVGLSSERMLSADFRAPPTATLAFSYGVPEPVRSAEGGAVLELTLASAEKTEEHSYPLEGGSVPSAWHRAAIPLAAFGGEDVEARFELRGPTAGEVVCALGVPTIARPGRPAPTVLLVTSDTHRADHLGLARDGAGVRTPFLDALATRGALFEDCWSTTNITAPSHVAVLTGVHPRDTAIVDNVTRFSGEVTTLAEVFRDAGWVTYAGVSVICLTDGRSGLGRGFDRMAIPSAEKRDSAETIASLEPWIEEARGLPLFVWLHVYDAHTPYDPPEALARSYFLEGEDRSDAGRVVARYKGEVTYLDGELAELVGAARFADNAIVAVTGDHGESLLERSVRFSHPSVYPETLSVPLVIAGPGVPAGSRFARPVQQSDLGRTLLDLAGLAGTAFPGTNLFEETDAVPRFALASHANAVAVQQGRWFLFMALRSGVRGPLGTPSDGHRVELFDLASDPGCTRDLAADEPERARAMRRLVVEWLGARRPGTMSLPTTVHDRAALQALAQLGYAAGDDDAAPTEWFDRDCDCAWCARYR